MIIVWFIVGFGLGALSGVVPIALFCGVLSASFGALIMQGAALRRLKVQVARLEKQMQKVQLREEPEVEAPAPLAPPEEAEEPTVHEESQEIGSEWELAPKPDKPKTAAPASTPQPVARAATARKPEPPNPVQIASDKIRSFITGGNTLARVGLLVLLVGIVLLLKYAVDNNMFPVEMRMASAAVLGMALVGIGFWQRVKRPDFSLIMQGGGVATMYLTVFFSYRVYELIPGAAAFALLSALAIFSGIMAVTQNSLTLILIGIVGGFLAPILASTGSNNHVALFSYYLILNLLIAGVAWFKVWRPLNLVGFIFTFGIGTLWGVLTYKGENFSTTEPFLVAFFLLYVAIVVIFAWRKQVNVRAWVDGSLTFGTPLAFLGLQYSMVHDMPFAMAYTTMGMAGVYIIVASLLHRRAPEFMRNLVESFLALGVGFATLAVPYGFSNHSLTGATWAVEGLGLFWLGVRQHRALSRWAGLALQFLAGGALLYSLETRRYPSDALPILNTFFMGCVLLCAGGLGIAWIAHRKRAAFPRSARLLQGLIVWALVWWYPSALLEVSEHVQRPYQATAILLIVAATGFAFEYGASKFKWIWGRLPAMLSIPAVLLMLVHYQSTHLAINPPMLNADHVRGMEWALGRSPLESGGWLSWPSLLLAMFVTARRFARDQWELGRLFLPATVWVTAIFAGLLLSHHVRAIDGLGGSWALVAKTAGVMGVAAFVLRRVRRNDSDETSQVYRRFSVGGLMVLLLLWFLRTNFFANGDSLPVPFAPLANPLDIGLGLVLCCIGFWAKENERSVLLVLPPMAFLWINGMLARSVHQFAGIPWQGQALWDSDAMQMAVSVTWTIIGLGTVLWATKRKTRLVWFVGAVLLGVVVGKLFLIDIAHLGTVIKIVTFLVVGALLLVVGFFSPMPPSAPETSPTVDPNEVEELS